jgi:hypothetical protein
MGEVIAESMVGATKPIHRNVIQRLAESLGQPPTGLIATRPLGASTKSTKEGNQKQSTTAIYYKAANSNHGQEARAGMYARS